MTRRSRPIGFFGPLLAALLACSSVAVIALATPAAATTFSNNTAIITTDPPCGGSVGPATLYPSNISVSGLTGTVSDVNVTFHGMNHFSGEFDILLVGPGGGSQNLVVLSDAGTQELSNFTLTLDDSAPNFLPVGGVFTPTAKPTDYAELSGPDAFPSPAPPVANRPGGAPGAPLPGAGTATLASVFNGINPNGTWSLYVVGDACDDPPETITGGWSLDITTASGAATTTNVVSTPNPSTTGQSVTFTATVTSGGSPVTTGTVTFTEGAATLASNVPLNGSGQASFSTSGLAEGNHVVTATYNGTPSFSTSNGSVNHRVNNATVQDGNTFCNTGAITVNALPNPATPYPSNIFVSGLTSNPSKVTVTLKNISHPFADDINVLLVGPGSQNLVLLSDAGSGATMNVNVTLDDAAAGSAPTAGALGPAGASVTYKPTDHEPAGEVDVFPSPAPAPSTATTLATFNGVNPNGTWSLYVASDGAPETGSIAGGWCLNFTLPVAPTVTTVATATAALGQPISDTATVTGVVGRPAPTGTVTFTAFGPNNATCAGPSAFVSSPRPLGGGPPPTATSNPFTPASAGTYRWTASYSGDVNYLAATTACNDANETSVVSPGTPVVTTSATATATLGQPISDTATVTGVAGGAVPTGTVTFTAFGPNNATCAGPPAFTSGPRALGGGPPPTASSGPYTPTAIGTYRWIASYSGDANYVAVTTACNDANETSVVSRGTPVVTTSATVTATLGQPINDTATVTGVAGAPAPTGTVTFTVFGPNDATCAGPPAFSSSPQTLAGGPPPTTASGPFTPTLAGTYRWVASYSGDSNYVAVITACNDANETSVVNRATPTVATNATATATLGQHISDTATVTGLAGGPAPTGTVTFTVFGPNDATCAGPAAFSSGPQTLAGGPPPTSASGPFAPTAAGSYRWIASYSGDSNYAAVSTACNEANETSVVNPATPTVATTATATATLGQPISDTATVTGVAGGPAPTGTVTFTAFGPNDATCAGPAAFSSGPQTLAGGPPPTASSGPFPPTSTGIFRWIASYSGDANYTVVTTACNEANETSVVNPATPTVATTATATATLGQSISDTATVTGVAGGPAPTGTVTFTVFGPDDATCAGPAAFSSGPQTLAGGPPPTAGSGPFTPTSAGTYRWGASYSGDTNYTAVTTACNEVNETSVVSPATPTVATTATATATLRQSISDTATVTGVAGGPAPTGTVTFTVFGPDDATCAGPAAFSSGPQTLAGGPPPTAGSGPFTPTSTGTYRWIASYSGDVNYTAVTTACNDANEASVVSPATPTVATSATPFAPFGQPISDTATVTGVAGAPAPTGTVTFSAFGPDDTACAGPPAFSSGQQALGVGSPPTAGSGPFTPTSTGTYRWTAAYSGDGNYTAVTTACNDVNETSTVGFPGPHMTLTKTPSAAFAAAPATITYTFTLVNDGSDTLFHVTGSDSNCLPVVFQSGDVDGDQLLDPGETWTFTCSTPINAPGTYTNTAQASGFNTQTGLAVSSNQAQATVAITTGVSGGHMLLSKEASPTTGQVPLPVTYTFTLLNDGSNPLAGVSLTDDQCSPAYQSGDFDSNGVLSPGEGWTYTCSVTHNAVGTYTNSAGATATDTQTGQSVTSNTATATVNATGPAPPTTTGPHITLSKSANPTGGPAPLAVTYTYALVNDGTDTLFHVSVADNTCSPVTRVAGDVDNDTLLDAGETWTFTCSTTLTTAGSHTNTATASGTNTQTGLPVSSNTAQATVTLS